MYTYLYHCLIVLDLLCLPKFITPFYLRLHLLTYVYPCLLMFTYVYNCLLVFTYVYTFF